MSIKTIFRYEPFYKYFLETEEINTQKGVGLPAHSTEIPPPESWKQGEIPIFENNCWKIVEDTFWKSLYKELNYDAGRKMATYKDLHLSMYSNHFPSYPQAPFINTHLTVSAIIQRNRMIHQKFHFLIEYHRFLLDSLTKVDSSNVPSDMLEYEKLATLPTNIFTHKLEAEALIYIMRRVLDSLIQLTDLIVNFEKVVSKKAISINDIGRLNNDKKVKKVINGDGDQYLSDETNFLNIINDLFNGYKHHLVHDETYNQIGVDFPSLTTLHTPNNNFNTPATYHNHNLYHIMMGYQDTVERILKNQKIFITLSTS